MTNSFFKKIKRVAAISIIGSIFLCSTQNVSDVFGVESDDSSVISLSEYSDAVTATRAKKNHTAIEKVDSAVIDINTDFTAVDTNTFIIMAAAEEMEKTVLDMLQTQLNAERCDKDAIFTALSGLTPEQVSTALKGSLATSTAFRKVSELKKSVVQDVSDVLKALKESNKTGNVVIVNIYNPLAGINGGTVSVAKAALQLYVDEINSMLSQIAVEEGAVIADVSQTYTSVTSLSGLNGDQLAETLETVLGEQHDSIMKAVNSTVVSAPSVGYTYGDINNDGQIDSADLTLMLRYQLSYDRELRCPDDESITDKGYNFKAGDVCKDGVLCDVYDLTFLKRYILGSIDASVLGKVIY